MTIAAHPLLTCDACKRIIAAGEPYVVTPSVTGALLAGVVCLACGPDEARPMCNTCHEPIEPGDEAVHTDDDTGCMPLHAYCGKCETKLTAAELESVRCTDCGKPE